MKRFAVLDKSGLVLNVLAGEDEKDIAVLDGQSVADVTDKEVGPGFTRNGKGEFRSPEGDPANDADPEADAARVAGLQRRYDLRGKIAESVGDEQSILGTLADVTGILLSGQAARVIALADHASNEAQRQELAMLKSLAGDVDLVAESRKFIAAIQSGDIVLTAATKGFAVVIAEASERSTKTAALLASEK